MRKLTLNLEERDILDLLVKLTTKSYECNQLT